MPRIVCLAWVVSQRWCTKAQKEAVEHCGAWHGEAWCVRAFFSSFSTCKHFSVTKLEKKKVFAFKVFAFLVSMSTHPVCFQTSHIYNVKQSVYWKIETVRMLDTMHACVFISCWSKNIVTSMTLVLWNKKLWISCKMSMQRTIAVRTVCSEGCHSESECDAKQVLHFLSPCQVDNLNRERFTYPRGNSMNSLSKQVECHCSHTLGTRMRKRWLFLSLSNQFYHSVLPLLDPPFQILTKRRTGRRNERFVVCVLWDAFEVPRSPQVRVFWWARGMNQRDEARGMSQRDEPEGWARGTKWLQKNAGKNKG